LVVKRLPHSPCLVISPDLFHTPLTKPPLLADPQYSSAAPAWSPDGSQIAFITDRTGQWEIWVMNADGSNQHALFSSEAQAQLGLNYQGVNERLLNWVN
jgi:Tol biopolymer transport system component